MRTLHKEEMVCIVIMIVACHCGVSEVKYELMMMIEAYFK